MFIENIRDDFYNVLLGNRVLLLVHYDTDAICTCKILQGLFKCDNIAYTLVPVGSVSELKTAYEENNEEIKYVVLVNCGGTLDLVDILQPEEDVVFFVLDSHKPTDVCNVYSDGQVRLVYKDNEENIPNFDDIFRDDEDEEEPEMSGGREGLEAAAERRRERRGWEERRHTLMVNYTQFSYYGKPSALVALDLAQHLSRCSTAVMWAASVASAAQSETCQRDQAKCLLDAEALTRGIASAAGSLTDKDHAARVVVEKDVILPLYRSWSVEGSLHHSPALAPPLKLHAPAGKERARRLLADMGFPLQQARQAYRSMDVELRRALLPALEAAAERHGLPVPARAAFLLRAPHTPDRAAADLHYAVHALIEHESIPRAEGFQMALAALTAEAGECGARAAGLAAAQRALVAVATLVHGVLAARRLRHAGPFSYFDIQEGSAEAALVRGPLWLGVAARWVSRAGGGTRPVLAAAPRGQQCLLIGVPPRFEGEPRNLFGAAFEHAASRSGATVSLEHFDSSVATLPASQQTQFLDALCSLLS